MFSLVRILWKFCAGEDNWEAENGNDISVGYKSFNARQPRVGNSATTESIIFESRIHGRHFGGNLPEKGFHKLPTSTESTRKELASSESSASASKPTTSSEVSVEESLPLIVTNRLGKATSVQVEEGRTHVRAIPRANEALAKKENVPLAPSTSKMPTQSALSSKQNNQQGKARYTWAGQDKTPVGYNSCDVRQPLIGNPATTESIIFESRIHGRHFGGNLPEKGFHKLPTSTESTRKELASSESSASALKPTKSSEVSVEESLLLHVINRLGKATSVQVEKGRTHVRAIPTANEALAKKVNVPLAPSTSKMPTQSALLSKQNNQQGKARYTWAGQDKTPVYSIPEAIENMLNNDMVPDILLKPLSPSNYKDYFVALLCAEEYYIQKWNGFALEDVSLELHEAEIIKRSSEENRLHENQRNRLHANHKKENKIFVAFEIDSVPEWRPFLLSRDFVFARPSGEQRDPFKGFVYRVKRSTHVLVEFGKDFHSQHHSSRRYDVSFSFNRVCLKRAHHAIVAVSDLLFRSYIFPDHISRENTPTWPTNWFSHRLSLEQKSAVCQILSCRSPPSYLVEGPLCVTNADGFPLYDSKWQLSETGMVVKEAVVQILRRSSLWRVLICAPINKTCDVLMRGLVEEIPESDMFRANAAYREKDEVPIDILDLSSYEGECFTCPSLEELRKYRVITSTFMSSFRLHSEGLAAGHFSHIFLLDASSASEPETMVALSNFATNHTTVVVTGDSGNIPRWIRSDIARKHGLRLSYFQRLSQRKPYKNLDPMFITKLVR